MAFSVRWRDLIEFVLEQSASSEACSESPEHHGPCAWGLLARGEGGIAGAAAWPHSPRTRAAKHRCSEPGSEVGTRLKTQVYAELI